MAIPVLPQRIPQDASIGARASFTRTLTEADAALFIGVTWDVNPLHTDESYAGATRFKRRTLPGLLTASLLTHLGGLWAFMATEMRFEFLAPVFPGETITAVAEVVEADPSRNWVHLHCICTNQDGTQVLQGDVYGYPGKFES
jgi:3-hydroxybutyryl-CoA dehydratase